MSNKTYCKPNNIRWFWFTIFLSIVFLSYAYLSLDSILVFLLCIVVFSFVYLKGTYIQIQDGHMISTTCFVFSRSVLISEIRKIEKHTYTLQGTVVWVPLVSFFLTKRNKMFSIQIGKRPIPEIAELIQEIIKINPSIDLDEQTKKFFANPKEEEKKWNHQRSMKRFFEDLGF